MRDCSGFLQIGSHIYIYIYIYIYIIHVCIYVRMSVCLSVCLSACVYVCIYVCTEDMDFVLQYCKHCYVCVGAMVCTS